LSTIYQPSIKVYTICTSLFVSCSHYDILYLAMVNVTTESSEDANNKITVLVADDHPLICFALKRILEEHSDIKVVAEVGDGEAAVKAALELTPDLVIIDIAMPVLNGLEATKQIKAKCPSILILVLTVHSDIEHIFGIFEAGADGYLTKSVLGQEVVHSIRGLIAGETVLSPEVFKLVLRHAMKYPIKPVALTKVEHLTSREQEILLLAAKGMGNQEIAERLGLRPSTIKSHFVELFLKLGVRTRTEAVINALRSGMITINEPE